MTALLSYALAALCEIADCFAFWRGYGLANPLWTLPGRCFACLLRPGPDAH